jgi:phage I-like protein
MDTKQTLHLMQARHSVELAARNEAIASPPEWVQLLPAGEFHGRDGRGPYRNIDPHGVIESTMAYQAGADIPMDYDHQLEYSASNGKPAPASGWIVKLEVRGDGSIWGRPSWTEKAAAHIVAREFRYLSPVFRHTADGRIVRIESAALTNVPNLDLVALASRQRGAEAQPHTREEDMDLKKTLTGILGLPADSADDTLTATVQGLVTAAHSAGAGMATIAKAVGAPDGATADVIATEVRALASRATAPDPAKFVPIAMYQEASTALSGLRKEMAVSSARSLVEEAKATHKVSPAMEEWAQGYAEKDPEGFKAWMSASAPVVPAGPQTPEGTPPSGTGSLTDTDRAVCAQLGITETDYIKSIQAAVGGKEV